MLIGQFSPFTHTKCLKSVERQHFQSLFPWKHNEKQNSNVTHRDTDKQTHAQIGTHTHAQKHTHTEIQTHIHIDKHTQTYKHTHTHIYRHRHKYTNTCTHAHSSWLVSLLCKKVWCRAYSSPDVVCTTKYERQHPRCLFQSFSFPTLQTEAPSLDFLQTLCFRNKPNQTNQTKPPNQ